MMKSAPQKYKAAIIGTGMIFREHYEAYRALNVEIKSVSDIDAKKLAEIKNRYALKNAVEDWREIIADPSIQIVSICTPPKLHCEMVMAALRADKHVICEKPLAVSLAEIDKILKVEKTSKGRLAVAHQFRYSPNYQKLKLVFEEQALGRVSLAHCLRYDAPPEPLLKQGIWGNWELNGGGVLMTKAIHQVDLLLWLLGKVKRVQAMMGTFFFPIESEDQLVANIEFENGALANLCISGQPHTGYRETLDFAGTEGSVCLPWRLKIRDAKKQSEVEAKVKKLHGLLTAPSQRKSFFKKHEESSYQLARRHFLMAFLKGLSDEKNPMPVSATEAREAIEVCTAIYAAAIKKCAINLPIDSQSPYYHGITKENYHGN